MRTLGGGRGRDLVPIDTALVTSDLHQPQEAEKQHTHVHFVSTSVTDRPMFARPHSPAMSKL